MKETIRKAFLLGVGSLVYSKNVAEKNIKKFIKDNDINSTEAENLFKDLLKDVDKFRKEQEKMIKDIVEKAQDRTKFATKSDIERLEGMIKKNSPIEKKVRKKKSAVKTKSSRA